MTKQITLYDLHAHLLPAIDDGPGKIEETLEIIRISSEQGVDSILATPHRKDVSESYSVAYVEKLLCKVNDLASEHGYSAKVLLGGQIATPDPEFAINSVKPDYLVIPS